MLLHRQFDIETDRPAARLFGSAVGGPHDAGAAAGDHAVAGFDQHRAGLPGGLIIRRILRSPGGTEHRQQVVRHPAHRFKTFDKLGHDAQNAPGVHRHKVGIGIVSAPGMGFKLFTHNPYLLNS